MADGGVTHALLVPGLPHILARQGPGAWRELRSAVEAAGDRVRDEVDTWLIVSTSWFTVLGFQFQMDPHLAGLRVDENWYNYDFGEIRYDFRTDQRLTETWAGLTRAEGQDVHLTNYEGFPIDTGTAVALALLDPEGRHSVAAASMNLYAGPELMEALGRTARAAAVETGQRVGAVAISGLSSGMHQRWLTGETDSIVSDEHDRWNREMLDLLAQGRLDDARARRADYSETAAADSRFRALTFLAGTGAIGGPADVMAYGPIWGSGAAVVHWAPGSRPAAVPAGHTERGRT